MTLTLYNSMTRKKESFQPLEPGKVSMYYCGVTVYDYCHLGHARACIIWDVVRRYLQWSGYDVCYVQNFTDIDDKILNRARSEGTSMEAVSERFIQAYFDDMARLNVMEADDYPRATHTMDGIKRLIAELERKQFAYASKGDVYYRVHSFPAYGKLSGRKLDDMQAGASGRLNEADPEAPQKEDPFDFALWKGAKSEEPAWESPWGQGRPGWHIECSAMVRDRLGETIDIHAGGADLVFPHHENEIAQSEAANGKPLANYWLHNGMVNVGGEKMSKSLGNFTTIRQLLDAGDGPPPMALRLFVLQAQYRKPLDFYTRCDRISEKQLANPARRPLVWLSVLVRTWVGAMWQISPSVIQQRMRIDTESDPVERFRLSMDDDLNTASATTVLFCLS